MNEFPPQCFCKLRRNGVADLSRNVLFWTLELEPVWKALEPGPFPPSN